MKGVLSKELENSRYQETRDDLDKINEDSIVISDNGKVCKKNYAKKTLYQLVKSVAVEEIKKYCINNTNNLEVSTVIPIRKPRPAMRNDFNPAHSSSVPVRQVVHASSSPLTNAKFTIPCQRAADVLEMSIKPREVSENKLEKIGQSKLELSTPNPSSIPINHAPIISSISANQVPTTVFVHNDESEEHVSILFKPKAISLIQLYGNLLKKITITVLVPYHMSQMGQPAP